MGSIIRIDRRVQRTQFESSKCQPYLRELATDLQDRDPGIRSRAAVVYARQSVFVVARRRDKDQCNGSDLPSFERFVAKIRKTARSFAVEWTVGVGFSRFVPHRQYDLALQI